MIDKLDICTKALSLRKKLGVDVNSPIDILSLLQSISKLTLIFYPMGENLSGMCIRRDNNPVIAINSSMSIGRQRFSMAHELYHLYFDENKHSPVCAINIGNGNEIEKSSDQFASYFLMPPLSLSENINRIKKLSSDKLRIKEIVKLEQYFGVSRQSLLYRLYKDKSLTFEETNKYRLGVIKSAINLGYDDTLYKPLPKNKQFRTYGYFIQQAEKLLKNDIISNSKYEELLLTAFRPDLVFGENFEEGELND